MDETASACDLILPVAARARDAGATPSRRAACTRCMQPAMQHVPMFDAQPAGDTLIALAQGRGRRRRVAGDTGPTTCRRSGSRCTSASASGRDFETFWNDALKDGGVWEDAPRRRACSWSATPAFAAPELKGAGDLAVRAVRRRPNFYDGRGANKPWLQELPDPTTKAVWGSWAEIHPETAAKLGVAAGDAAQDRDRGGHVEVPAYLYAGMRKDMVAIPLGQGHTAYGRYAKGRGVNALALLSPAQDAASGAVAYLSAKAQVSRGRERRWTLAMHAAREAPARPRHRADHSGGGAARGRRRQARAKPRGTRRPRACRPPGSHGRRRRRPARQAHRAHGASAPG